MPIPVLRRQKQAALHEFKATLVFNSKSRIARDTQQDPVSRKQSKTKQNPTPHSAHLSTSMELDDQKEKAEI